MIDYQPPAHTDPEIIYHDSDILIVSKPAGLLSVPGRGADRQDCMIARVQCNYPQAVIVHRLDMSTSGLIVMALNKVAQRHLSRQFEQRQVKKIYSAMVNGCVVPLNGRVELPLICDWPNRPRQMVDHAAGKTARTDYRVLSYDDAADATRMELKPVTGRTHQLRVHMQALGHPILGDDLYADKDSLAKASRLLLHASTLIFSHPETLERLIFTHEVPF